MYGGPSTSFLRHEPLKNDVTIFDPFSGLKTHFRHFPTPSWGLLVCKNEKLNCFDIHCVVEASSVSLNHNVILESKENYPRHTKTVQNSLGFMPEVKPLHKPRGDLVLCALLSETSHTSQPSHFAGKVSSISPKIDGNTLPQTSVTSHSSIHPK